MIYTFRLPSALVEVPAATERHAREALRRTCYDGAPVDAWPCVGWAIVTGMGSGYRSGRNRQLTPMSR